MASALEELFRQEENNTPILMLTAKSSVDDKVTGLDCGADGLRGALGRVG